MKKLTKKQKTEAVKELQNIIDNIQNDEYVGVIAIPQYKEDNNYGGCFIIGNIPIINILGNLDMIAHKIKAEVCKQESEDKFEATLAGLREEGLEVSTSGPYTPEQISEQIRIRTEEAKEQQKAFDAFDKIIEHHFPKVQDKEDFLDQLEDISE